MAEWLLRVAARTCGVTSVFHPPTTEAASLQVTCAPRLSWTGHQQMSQARLLRHI